MDPEKIELSVTLTVAEVNYILECLGKRPFDDVYAIISKIKVQGDTQLKGMQDAMLS